MRRICSHSINVYFFPVAHKSEHPDYILISSFRSVITIQLSQTSFMMFNWRILFLNLVDAKRVDETGARLIPDADDARQGEGKNCQAIVSSKF